MFQALVDAAGRLASEFSWSLRRVRTPTPQPNVEKATSQPLQPLKRVLLTDGVSRTLFEEYTEHQASDRGAEETGWIILGHRKENEAIVLATLPAGTQRQAGVAHVGFNSLAQAVGCRIVRQWDRRLTILGVVHTHPGSMRHPSEPDFRGDSRWIRQLRGKEGVFAIGTADNRVSGNGLVAEHPRPHVQTWGKLCLSWYSLRESDSRYRPIPVDMTLGPDLARSLHPIWPTIEAHAEPLERLAVQQAGVKFNLVDGEAGPALTVTIPLAEPESALRLILEGDDIRYVLERDGDYLCADTQEPRIDRGVYLLLAELASKS